MTTSSTRMDAVKAVVWKEWRERFLWAVGASAVMGLLFLYIARGDAASGRFNDYRDIWDSTWMPLFIGAMAAGVLGFSQMNSELQRDKWAFLTHRPASSSTLFWSKAMAGLLLFVLSIAVPFACFVMWVRAPGNVSAPFDWRLLTTGCVIAVCGTLFYFAGALTAVRDRPWWGSRAWAVPAVFVCISSLMMRESLLSGFLVIGFCLFFAVASAYLSFKFRDRTRKPLMYYGVLLPLLFVGLQGVAIVATTFPFLFKAPDMTKKSSYHVTGKGEVFRSFTQRHMNGELTDATTIADLQGRVVAKDNVETESFFWRKPGISFTLLLPTPAFNSPFVGGFERYFRALPNSQNEKTVWYLERINRRISGYSKETRRLVGYVGRNGFSKNASDVQPFEGEALWSRYDNEGYGDVIALPHRVLLFNSSTRSAVPIFDSPLETIRHINRLTWGNMVVMTDSQIHVLTKQGRALFSTPLSGIVKDSALSMARTAKGDRFWLLIQPKNEAAKTTLLQMSARGAITKRWDLPTLPDEFRKSMASNLLSSTILLPPIRQIYLRVKNGESLDAMYAVEKQAARTGAVISLILSACAALLAHLRARRYAFKSSTRWAWTIGVLLLGPLGFPLMIALLDWPTREKCASCGKLRVVNRENCEHCQSAFSASPPDGTEIYDDDETARTVSARGEKLVAL